MSPPGMRTIYIPDRQKPLLAHTSTPEGRSMVNPGRRSEATTPGGSLIHPPCTLKGRSSEHTVSPYICIFQSIAASALTSCVRRCAPSGCNDWRRDTWGVVTAFLRPRLTMLRPSGVDMCAEYRNETVKDGWRIHFHRIILINRAVKVVNENNRQLILHMRK